MPNPSALLAVVHHLRFAHASGTQTAVIGTEHDLDDVATVGVFQFCVDAAAMIDGDVVELRCYQKILTGGTERGVWFQRYADAQAPDDMIKTSMALTNQLVEAASMKFTLTQTAGVGRAFPWKVMVAQ